MEESLRERKTYKYSLIWQNNFSCHTIQKLVHFGYYLVLKFKNFYVDSDSGSGGVDGIGVGDGGVDGVGGVDGIGVGGEI